MSVHEATCFQPLRLLAIILFLLGIGINVVLAVESRDTKLLSSDFDSFAETVRQDWGVPGISLSVVKLTNNSFYASPEVDIRTYGVAGINRPVDAQTTFGMASNSKLFTAAAIGSLVDAGKLNWTTPIRDVLPGEFSLLNDFDGRQITIRDALSHRSGLPRHDFSMERVDGPGQLAIAIGRIQHLEPSAQFRDIWQYNNQMFMTGARIVEKVTGMAFQQYVSSHFFNHPLINMTRTSYQEDETYSHGYELYPGNRTAFSFPWVLAQVGAGAGGVISTPGDMAKWVAFLMKTMNAATLGTPVPAGSTPLSPESLMTLATGYMLETGFPQYPEISGVSYGQGVELLSYQGVNVWRHGGSMPGMGSEVFWVPEAGVGVAVMGNTMVEAEDIAVILGFRVLEELIGLPLQPDWNGRFLAANNITLLNTTSSTPPKRSLRPLTRNSRSLCPPPQRLSTRKPPSRRQIQNATFTDPSHYIGYFNNPGYGNLTICPTPDTAHLYSTPVECQSLLYDLIAGGTYVPSEPPKDTLTLLVIAPRIFMDYIQLSYNGDSTFTGTIFLIAKPDEGRTWPISWVMGEMGAAFTVGKEGVVGMDWWGIWGAGVAAVEDPEQVEVSFQRTA
ncbi:hypothetical protein JAAARDRAFT_61796 [Jaapia argillacea MUCL 33604]|uniref:Beta-lactamase-related domain-containing protein n=1 Tax=Jaapia argillacea MUCL 33604 TaxID=933084 RepID=A0A067PCL7_9AGAM|nr:hypothetical protein JAAARDRAFT_61796 [Jaapia argillacea MUCL 33604]